MLTSTWSTVGKRLRQVQTHVRLQFQPHRPPVLGSRFHHRLFYSLLLQPRQQAVQLARHRDESPPRWFLFRPTCIHDNYHQNFLVYVYPCDLHRFLLTWKRQNAREKGYTPSRATSPCFWQEWRDTDWFKTRVPDQTQKRPHFIQSVNRPLPSTLHQRTRTDSTRFSCQWVGRRPMRNSKCHLISDLPRSASPRDSALTDSI